MDTKMEISKSRNCSIDIFRYICAIMVIAIHTHPFEDINSGLGYVCTQVIPRIAVSFFFAVSGYFYIKKMLSGEKIFFSYIKRTLQIYIIWSVIYFLLDFVTKEKSITTFIKDCVISFFVTGSYYHFWYFPALIFSVCVVTLLYKMKGIKLLLPVSILLYIIGCLGCSYYSIGNKILILGELYSNPHFYIIRRILLMGLPFFASGYLIALIEEKMKKVSNSIMFGSWLASILAFIIEIILVRKFELQINIILTLALYLLVCLTLLNLLNNPMKQLEKISHYCKVCANFTYYSHPFFIVCITFVCRHLTGNEISQTPLFLLTTIITLIVGICIGKLNNKYINFITN